MAEPTVSNFPKPEIKAPSGDFNLPLVNHHVMLQTLLDRGFIAQRKTSGFGFENPLHNLQILPGALSAELRKAGGLPKNYGAAVTALGYHAGGHSNVIDWIETNWAAERQRDFRLNSATWTSEQRAKFDTDTDNWLRGASNVMKVW